MCKSEIRQNSSSNRIQFNIINCSLYTVTRHSWWPRIILVAQRTLSLSFHHLLNKTKRNKNIPFVWALRRSFRSVMHLLISYLHSWPLSHACVIKGAWPDPKNHPPTFLHENCDFGIRCKLIYFSDYCTVVKFQASSMFHLDVMNKKGANFNKVWLPDQKFIQSSMGQRKTHFCA